MIEVGFYCDIITDGEVIEDNFLFDECTFHSKKEIKKYMEENGYEVGQPCGEWGDGVGILREVIYDEIDRMAER